MEHRSQLILELSAQLEDRTNPIITPLVHCGHDALDSLLCAARKLRNTREEEELKEVRRSLEALVDIAHRTLPKASGLALTGWRRMHTDSCILLAITMASPEYALHAVATLDHAIIISGASDREDLVALLIKNIQQEFLQTVVEKSPSQFSSDFDTIKCPSASGDIPSLDVPPTLAAFRNKHSEHPFILRRYASDWPAVSEEDHLWRSVNYLLSVAGPGRVVPVEVGHDYRKDDWTQKLMNWDDLLSRLYPGSADHVLYLAQHNLFSQFPALQADIVIPDYVYTCPDPPSGFEGYIPPQNEAQLILNAWLGPKGTVSPAHIDPYFNVYVQVVGRKTVWLCPPIDSKAMYAFQADQGQNPAATPSMTNTARVDVFTQDRNADVEAHPMFWREAVPRAMIATLEPGDLLFFPPGWWHAMRSESISFSVSMWF